MARKAKEKSQDKSDPVEVEISDAEVIEDSVPEDTQSAISDDPTPSADPAPAPANSNSTSMVILTAVLALILGAGAVYFLQPQQPDNQAEIDQLSAQIESLSAAVAASDQDSSAVEAVSKLEGALAGELGGISGTIGGLTERLAEVDARMAALETQPVAAPGDVTGAIETLRNDLQSWQQEAARLRTENRDLNARLEDLEAQLAAATGALSSAQDIKEQSLAERTSGLMAQIEVALADGTPFDRPLAELASAIETDVPAPLSAAASSGVVTQSDLAAAFPDAARAALSEELKAQEDANAVDRASSFLRAQFGIRSVVPREGDDADAVLSRAQHALEIGDLSGAIDELAQLGPGGQAKMDEWISAAKTRAAALQALSQMMGQEG